MSNQEFKQVLQLKHLKFQCKLEEEPIQTKIYQCQLGKDNFTKESEITYMQNLLADVKDYKDYKFAIEEKLCQELITVQLDAIISNLFKQNLFKKSNELSNLTYLIKNVFGDLRNNTISLCEELNKILKRRGNFKNENEQDFMHKIIANAFYFKSVKNFFNDDMKDILFIKLTNDQKLTIQSPNNPSTISKELDSLYHSKLVVQLFLNFNENQIKNDDDIILHNEIIKMILCLLIQKTLETPVFKRLLLWSFGQQNHYSLSCLNDRWEDIFKVMNKNNNCYFILYQLSCKSLIKWNL